MFSIQCFQFRFYARRVHSAIHLLGILTTSAFTYALHTSLHCKIPHSGETRTRNTLQLLKEHKKPPDYRPKNKVIRCQHHTVYVKRNHFNHPP